MRSIQNARVSSWAVRTSWSDSALHVFDGRAPGLRTIRIVKDPACKGCAAAAG